MAGTAMVTMQDGMNVFFAKVAERFRLGTLLEEPQRVSGGFLHRMYRLDTETGSYALKLLNPEIMKRPDARNNYRLAESLEKQLQSSGLPIVASMEFDGKKMQQLEQKDFYLFPWVEGKALTPAEVTPHHCRQIGEILARQHALPCEQNFQDAQPSTFDWDGLLAEAKKCNACDIIQMLEEHGSLLMEIQQANHAATRKLIGKSCISNGDMDIKNVLWQAGKPLIIDLECLGYGHPEREMVMLALMWAGWETDHWKPENFQAFVESYTAIRGKPENDPAILYDSMDVWPEWLHYNVKRALGIEAQDEEERQLGLRQAQFAMGRVLFSRDIRQRVLLFLG